MTVYEIKNVTVTEMAGGRSYLIKTEEGYLIHLPEHTEYEYKPMVMLQSDYDFSKVQVCAVADVPEDPFMKEVNNG